MKNPSSVTGLPASLVHVLLIPVFFVLSVILYEFRPLVELMHSGDAVSAITNIYPFNIAIVSAILLVCMLLTRMTLFFIRHRIRLTVVYYSVWCIAEVVVMSAFAALFLTLISHVQMNYFVFLGNCFKSFASTLVFPYVIAGQAYYILDMRSSAGAQAEKEVRLKFYDNRKLLKLTTFASSVLYIKADENYLGIYHVEGDRVYRYELRNSMKAVENMCRDCGFVRVHRSYIVNPVHLKSVSKSEDGKYLATLEFCGTHEIPVSKKYYEDVVSLL